jgi:probable HAF family extracellular repeat protein
MNRYVAPFAVFLVILLASGGAALAQSDAADPSARNQNPAYVATDLGTLGGDISVATALSEGGRVVGWSTTATGQEAYDPGTHAFVWDDGRMADLGALDGDVSVARDVNEAGQVVGWSTIESGDPHAVLWESGSITDLGTLGGAESRAHAINQSGVVVGEAMDRNGLRHAIQWVDGHIEELGTLDGDESIAIDINDAGLVVGASSTSPNVRLSGSSGTHAVLWDNGTIKDLGTIGGGDYSLAYGVNEGGQVVGELASRPGADSGRDGQHAFVWAWGTITDLGTLGGPRSQAYDVNNRGQIAGVALTDGTGGGAAIWAGDGVLRLPGGDGLATGAQDINDAGQVVGYTSADQNHGVEAGTHAVLWEPGTGPREFEPRTGYATPTPVATPTLEPTVGQADMVVELGDIYFEPDTITIPADNDVTILLTNVGVGQHNFSIEDLNISVDLQPGESTTVTVSAPAGEYEFRCNIPGHTEAGQVGTLIAVGDSGSTPTPSPAAANGTGSSAVELDVELADIQFVPTELSVPAGSTVILNLTNTGVGTHDFVIDALGVSSGEIAGGKQGQVTFTAPDEPGEFQFYCSVPGHKEAGMVGTLTVTG